MKVLIVDDSKPIFMMVESMLVEASHEALWAEDGFKAIEVLEKNKVDIVLLDWNMPNMTGPEFLKSQSENCHTDAPIIMMTTENKPDKIREAISLGAAEYMMKPFTSDILFNKIELAQD